jgi:hypothetical protein
MAFESGLQVVFLKVNKHDLLIVLFNMKLQFANQVSLLDLKPVCAVSQYVLGLMWCDMTGGNER